MILGVNIVVCSLPRCGFIYSTVKSFSDYLELSAHGSSCHEHEDEEEPLGKMVVISNTKFCECELLTFVMMMPTEIIRSEGSALFVKTIQYSSQYSISILTLFFDIITPPPRLP